MREKNGRSSLLSLLPIGGSCLFLMGETTFGLIDIGYMEENESSTCILCMTCCKVYMEEKMLRGASLWQISGTKGEEWHGLYMRLGLPRKSYGYNPIGLQDSQ